MCYIAEQPMYARWLALVHQLPAHPSNVRVKIWRRLQQLGALALKNAVHLLPDSPQSREDFEWVTTEVEAAGGHAQILHVAEISDEEEVIRSFRSMRDREYRALAKEIDTMRKTLKRHPGSHDPLDAVRSLEERFDAIAQRDFFGSEAAKKVEAGLQKLADDAVPRQKSRPPAAPPFDAAQYRHRVWVTRPRPGVDRFASAWLIRRFIDREATFVFGGDPARFPEAVPFDMYVAAGFKHQGDLCTFEVLQRQFSIDDGAVSHLGEIVHDIDLKENRFKSPDTPTVRRVVEGLRAAIGDDATLLEHGITFFEALYQSFQPTSLKRARRARC
jgi:hypothetical protein